ncbi:MAG: alpha/beta hydrolase [Ruminococcaceae bacterium]|nr:alpha/beta hydrolase [Oscillospiraceae bacterium]
MDIQLHFVEKGGGYPLILLHGNGEDHSIFAAQFDAFAPYFHIYAPDTRGHGKTPRGTADFTISQFVDDLLHFMDARGIDKAHILGFSDGANIAMEFAVKYPDRVDKLVLNSGNFTVDGLKAAFLIPCRIQRAIAARKGDTQKVELLDLMLCDLGVNALDLTKIKSPTLVIAGTRDLIKRRHTELIAKCIAQSELAFVRGNHAVLRLNPAPFNRIVLDFLRK